MLFLKVKFNLFHQVADDLTELAGTVAGPPDTPYAGGKFKLEIKIPDTYPFNPPKVALFPFCSCFNLALSGSVHHQNMAP